MIRQVIATITTVFIVHSAQAACTNPAGNSADIFYNTSQNSVQFCDGEKWFNTGIKNPSAAGTSCTSPSSTEGSIFYNTSQNTVQFCNGDNWVNMGSQLFPSVSGTSCTNPVASEGSLFFNTTAKKLQFCNGENWVNAIYPKPNIFNKLHKFSYGNPSANGLGVTAALSGDYALLGTSGNPETRAFLFNASTGSYIRNYETDRYQTNNSYSQAMDADGKYAIVSASNDSQNGASAGAVFVYDMSTHSTERTLRGGSGNLFGISVGISGDNIAVGQRTGAFNNVGQVNLYNFKTGGRFATFTGSYRPSGYYGSSLAMHNNTLIVGDYEGGNSSPSNHKVGSVYIYDLSDNSEKHRLTLEASTTQDKFGGAVDTDGTYAIVGARDESSSKGAAYLYNVSTGALLHKFTDPDAENSDYFGWSVAVAGGKAYVGATRTNNDAGDNVGAVFVYDVTSGSLLERIQPDDGYNNGAFGSSIRVDGNNVLIGSQGMSAGYLYQQ